MPVIEVSDVGDPRLADYRHVPDPELLRRGEIFVAEGREVVRTLVSRSPYAVRSLLLTHTAFRALEDVLGPRLQEFPMYLVAAGAVEALTGFNIHRGCLAIGERPARRRIQDLLASLPGAPGSRPAGTSLVVLEGVGNADNMGGIFRNAAAFGASGVVLGPGCCDPLYRKAIRVSMGASLRVPFAHAGEDWLGSLEGLRREGFRILALTPSPGAVDLARAAAAAPVALLAGAEGHGLTSEALAASDLRVRIPMAPGTDSLNVATAVAIALHHLFAA